MKKFTKTLALTGALMLSSLGLVACGGGNNNIVDTSGNYQTPTTEQQATANSCVESLESVTLEENQSYEININLDMTMTYQGKTEKGKTKATGNVGANGDFYLDMNASSAGEKVKATMYFEVGEPSVFYMSNGEEKVKISSDILDSLGDAYEMDSMYDMADYVDQLNPQALKELISKNDQLTISYAETDSYLKIKYEQTGEDGTYTYYIVFNKVEDEYSFAGARMEMESTTTYEGVTIKMAGYYEFKLSTEKVKTLSETEKSEYIDISTLPSIVE